MKMTKDGCQQPLLITQTTKNNTEKCKTGKRGGIALVTRDEYYVKKPNKNTTYDSFEHAIWSTRIRNKDYTLIGLYHPPQGTQQCLLKTNYTR